MADQEFTVSAPYVRQRFDADIQIGADGLRHEVELPGFLDICVDVNGVPWAIASRKAPGLLADIARAKAAAEAESAGGKKAASDPTK